MHAPFFSKAQAIGMYICNEFYSLNLNFSDNKIQKLHPIILGKMSHLYPQIVFVAD
jgi:hypothetical protein